jgi:DNA-binding beta-propeller fold protein YncE
LGLLVLAQVASAQEIRQIPLATNDILYDPFTQKIYASVPSGAGGIGNSITVIDPVEGDVGASVFIGSEPGKLAISDDGRYLYAALDGAAAVRRFNIPEQAAELQFSLGFDPSFGPFFVEDIEVLPGNPEAVAVSRRNRGLSPRHEGVAIYDNGVQRPRTTPDHTGSNVIEFSASASRLYGLNNETTEFGFRRMSVDESGAVVVDVARDLVTTGFGTDIEFDDGRLYATNGRVIDPEARVLLGAYPGIPSASLVEPDSENERVFFLAGSGSTWTLRAFDLTTFIQVASLAIPGISGTPGSLVRWGDDDHPHRSIGLHFGDDIFQRDGLCRSYPGLANQHQQCETGEGQRRIATL